MPVYHLHADVITKGKSQGGAAGFRAYMEREPTNQASLLRRYIDPTHGREDLVASGSANLPRWAKDAEHFWQMADRYERDGWVVARTLEIALPRELSPEGQMELAQDLCEVTVGRFAHSWAIHEPAARDHSGGQPHIHIMYSPRREDVELDRTPAQWFAKAAAQNRNPLEGGVRKDPIVEKKAWLYDVREAVALLTNAALAREDLVAAVDHRSLQDRGLSRQPARYKAGDKADTQRVQEYRTHLRDSQSTTYEDLQAYRGWQKRALQYPSLERQYIKDVTRDHVWRFDTSPTRVREREESMQRQFTHAMEPSKHQRTERSLLGTRQLPSRSQRQPLAEAKRALAALMRQLEREEEDSGGQAARVRLFEEERERDRANDRGMGW